MARKGAMGHPARAGRAWSVPGAEGSGRGPAGAGTPAHGLPPSLPAPPSTAQPAPLTLRPGPIYAVDGDRGIGQRIVYSILQGERARPPRPRAEPAGTLDRGLCSSWPNPPVPPPPRKRRWHVCHQRRLGQPHHGPERPQPQNLPFAGQGGCPAGPPAPALSPRARARSAGTHGRCCLPAG